MKISIFIALVILVASGKTISEQEKFNMKGDEAVGTKFKENDATASVPFNKPYKDFSDHQKAIFRSNYDGILPTETPPFPKEGMQAIYAPIIKGHQKMAREGNLFAIAVIGKNGKVKKVDVYKAPNKHMAELAVTVLFNTEFDSATCDGEPCQMEFPLDIRLDVTL